MATNCCKHDTFLWEILYKKNYEAASTRFRIIENHAGTRSSTSAKFIFMKELRRNQKYTLNECQGYVQELRDFVGR